MPSTDRPALGLKEQEISALENLAKQIEPWGAVGKRRVEEVFPKRSVNIANRLSLVSYLLVATLVAQK